MSLQNKGLSLPKMPFNITKSMLVFIINTLKDVLKCSLIIRGVLKRNIIRVN